jgi:CubicO group peptidase (beta-lactamase class C family)/pimeloyl-ACP methyl ester carboxylesterase
MRHHLLSALLLASLLVGGCVAPPPLPVATPEPSVTPATQPPPSPAELAYEPTFEETDCPFALPPDEVVGETVVCGYVTVPEQRTGDSEATIRLAVVVFKAQAADPQPDPVILLSGGPGEKTVQAAVNVPFILGPFRAQRDIIAFDQRGVGLSEPALECPEWIDGFLDNLDELDPQVGLQALFDSFMACRDRLVAEGYNLSAFNTTENAADVDDIRKALGYEQVNLYGASYGSLLAQTVLRNHPESVRSAVLGAVMPAERSFFVHVPTTAVDATLHLLESCADDEACNAAYPDLKQVLFDVVERLNEDPLPITVTNPLDGQSYETWLTGDGVFDNLVVFLYMTDIIPVLPQAIYDVANGDTELMAQLSGQKLALLDATTRGMMFSVMCAEDLIGVTPEEYLAVRSLMPPPLAGRADPEDIIAYSFFGICENWPVEEADPSIKEPVISDVPILILEGEFDPVTPTAYARQVAQYLSNSYLYEFPGVGHNVFVASRCGREIATDFVDDPTGKPNDSCLSDMSGVVFDLPQEETGEITLEPFSSEQYGLTGVGPAQWEQPRPGTYVRGENALDPTALIHDVLEMSPAEVVDLVVAQLRLEQTPEPTGQREVSDLAWDLYSAEVQGVAVDFAVTSLDEDLALLVVLQSRPEERAILSEEVFLPAVDALRRLEEQPEAVAEPEPDEAATALVPFESDTFGIQGIVPEGWQEIAPGVFNRGQSPTDAARLIQQAAPGATVEQLVATLLGQLGIDALPESSGSLETDSFSWELYVVELEVAGAGTINLDLALAETEEGAALVLLQTMADEYEELHQGVFMPAVETLAPSSAVEEGEGIYQHPGGLFSVPIPTNWAVEERTGYATLTSPDGEIEVYVLALEADDLEQAVADGWALIDPEFDLDIDEVIDEPVTNGAERAITVTYDTGDGETIVMGGGWLHDGVAYLEYFRTTLEPFQKRAYQLSLIGTGYDIAALEETDLSGVEPRPLEDVLPELENFIQDKMEELEVVGASVAIVQDGELAYAKGFGVQDLDTGEPVTPQTLMMIGSTTKSMTTMLMAQLVDQGVFDWDTPVVEVLPSFKVADPGVTEEITMGNLVCACTGVPRRDLEWLFNASDLSAEDVVESLADFEFFTDFGEAFQYSNQMVATGGYLAALAAGGEYGDLYQHYVDILQAQVLDPIGMPNSTFSFEQVVTSGNYATPYGRTATGEIVELPLSDEEVLVPMGPAGALWSNVLDMANYLITDINQGQTAGGTQVVSSENLAVTWEPQVDITADASYGLGWIIEDYDGLQVLSHGGNTFGFSSELAFLPELDLGISILTNQRASAFNPSVRGRLLELLFDREPEVEAMLEFQQTQMEEARAELRESMTDIDPTAVEPFLGRWSHEALGEITLSWQDENLTLDAGEFASEIRARLSDDGEIVYFLYTPPIEGLPLKLEQQEGSDPTLVLGLGVVEYTFEKQE